MDMLVPFDDYRAPCRYCGAKGRGPQRLELKTYSGNYVERWRIWCSKCGLEGPLGKSEEEAYEFWNLGTIRAQHVGYFQHIINIVDFYTDMALKCDDVDQVTKEMFRQLREEILNTKW